VTSTVGFRLFTCPRSIGQKPTDFHPWAFLLLEKSPRVYFSGTDDKGRRWHGSSPGVGMFARMHRNKGRAPRPRPAPRAALRRALIALVEGIRTDNKIGNPPGPLTMHRNPFSVPSFAAAVALLYKAPRR